MRSVSNFLFPVHKLYTRIAEDNGSTCQDTEPQLQPVLRNHAYKPWTTDPKTLLICLVIIFTTFILTFLSLVWKGAIQLHWSWSPNPELPLETIIFRQNKNFSDPPTYENNALWMDLIGPSLGFVAIENAEKYDLPPGLSNLDDARFQNYGVSMYHQLHCLMKIRIIYWKAMQGEILWAEVAKGSKTDLDLRHVGHCFDYIRQGIMCAGDMSLEGGAAPDRVVVDGMETPHRCRSWEVAQKWMKDNPPINRTLPDVPKSPFHSDPN